MMALLDGFEELVSSVHTRGPVLASMIFSFFLKAVIHHQLINVFLLLRESAF